MMDLLIVILAALVVVVSFGAAHSLIATQEKIKMIARYGRANDAEQR